MFVFEKIAAEITGIDPVDGSVNVTVPSSGNQGGFLQVRLPSAALVDIHLGACELTIRQHAD